MSTVGSIAPGRVATVGVDLVDVVEVVEAIRVFGTRYLERIFTPAELRQSGPARSPVTLAGCFAAKEATLKALTLEVEAMPWLLIDVDLGCAADRGVALSGFAAEAAGKHELESVLVDVALTPHQALAVAFGIRNAARRE